MSSPTSTPKPADPFHNLWLQLRECHQEGLQELEGKVCKLKKERRLDAESLQLFYTHNQELKEQTKTLQDANSLLEDRLRTKECNRCATLEENLKKWQDHSERTIAKLKYERKCLEDENRKLQAELQILKTCSEPQVALSPEHEDGIIPDSPVLASSLPVANKLKKRKYTDNSRHVHYAEDFNWALFKDQELSDTTRLAKRTQMLAPNTCEMETSQILGEEENGVIADTCGLELVNTLHIKTTAEGKQFSSKPSRSSDVRPKSEPKCQFFSKQEENISRVIFQDLYNPNLLCVPLHRPRRTSSLSAPIHSPDSKSSSLLPRGEKLTDIGDLGKDKTTKDDDEAKGPEDGETCDCVNGKKSDAQVEPMKQTCKTMKAQSFTEPPGSRVQTLNQALNVDCGSPTFKIPKEDHRRRNHPQVQSATHKRALPENAQRKHTVENMWSIDPALALSMYDSEQGADEDKEQQREELLDSDCTWISHSLLQGRGEKDEDEHGVSGIGDKANDSLDRMFDTTAHEEYISYNTSQVASCPSEDEEEEDEKESPEKSPRLRKVQHPTFAHVAVVRKKDERRKLKGTTCKECEVYYAHLPEEEKVKKLSECSRHRHRFIPPSTPENFWEVGFPSTQTCIERGYIKEEQMPQSRLRRKQPFAALFSPKNSQQES